MNSPISVRPQVVRDADLSGKRLEADPIQTLTELQYFEAVRELGVHPLEFIVRVPAGHGGHSVGYVKGVFINLERGQEGTALDLPGLAIRAEEKYDGSGYCVKFGYQGDGMLTKDQIVDLPSANEAQAYLVSCSLAAEMRKPGQLSHYAMNKIVRDGFDKAFGESSNSSNNGPVASLEIKPAINPIDPNPETTPIIRVSVENRLGDEYGYNLTLSISRDNGASESQWKMTLLTKNDALVKHVRDAVALEAHSNRPVLEIKERMEQAMNMCGVKYLL